MIISTKQPNASWALCNGSTTTQSNLGLKPPDIYNQNWSTNTSGKGNVNGASNSFVRSGVFYNLSQTLSQTDNIYIKNGSPNFTPSDKIQLPSGDSLQSTLWTLDGVSFLACVKNDSSYFFKQYTLSGTQLIAQVSITIQETHYPYVKPTTTAWSYSNQTLYIANTSSNTVYKYTSSGYQGAESFPYNLNVVIGFTFINGAFYYIEYHNTTSTYQMSIHKSTTFNTSISKVHDIGIGRECSYIYYSDGMVIFICANNATVFDRVNSFTSVKLDSNTSYCGYSNSTKELFLYNTTSKTYTYNISTQAVKIISSLNDASYAMYYYNHVYYAYNYNNYKYMSDNQYKLPLITVDQNSQAQAYIKIKEE